MVSLLLHAVIAASAASSGALSITVAIDPGHGTARNNGARTALCETEADVTLDLARALAAHLAKEPDLDVVLLRRTNDGPSYRRRIQRAAAAKADVLISIHGDYRGVPELWEPEPGRTCERHPAETGFAVLYADRGEAARVTSRRRLARAIARRMRKGGFEPYSGSDYGSQYEADATPGTFRDRRGLFMLRRPAMPSVIVETHHLLNEAEHAHWSKPATHAAFAKAIAEAIRLSVPASRVARRRRGTSAP